MPDLRVQDSADLRRHITGAVPLSGRRREPLAIELSLRPSGRDALLDLLRGVALIRVVVWHTFSAPWMTAFAAMPVMFFVVGTMLPDVRTWRGYVAAVRRRGQRVLVPFWAYGAVIWGIAAIYELNGPHRPALPSPHWSTLNWVVPLDDPTGATFHGGWLSSHLWYLRAYVWVILAIPLLAFAARRIRVSVAACVAAVIALEVAGRHSWPVLGSGTARLLIGDFVSYGIFVILGIWFAKRRKVGAPGLSRRKAGAAAVASAVGAVALWRIAGLPGGEINNSYPALVLAGLAWLAAAQAAEGPLRRFAERPGVSHRSQALSGRALTVYLWHPAAIVVAHKLVQGSGLKWVAASLAAVGVGTWACVFAFGWLEDRARPGRGRRATATAPTDATTAFADAVRKRQKPARSPLRFPQLLMPIVGLVVVTVSVSQLRHDSAAAASGVPPMATAGVAPSYREALRNDAFPKLTGAQAASAPGQGPLVPRIGVGTSAPTTRPPNVVRPPVSTAPSGVQIPDSRPASIKATSAAASSPAQSEAVWTSAQFQDLLDTWLVENPTVGSVTAAVVVDDQIWTGEAHQDDTPAFRSTDRYPILSITKTFTAALVLQAVDRGLVALDEQMPALAGVDAPGQPVTVRQLLTHESGLVDYTEAKEYRPDQPITPLEAVNLSTRTALRTAPGGEVHYANTNFLYLELLLEERTGRPFSALVADLVGSVALHQTTLEAPDHPGWAASGSGGIYSTVTDLAEWSDVLFMPGRVLSAESIAQMTTLDAHNIGLGTWPVCPCWTDNDDVKHYTAIGHHFGSGGVERFPATGVSVAARIDPTSDAAGGRAAEIGVKYSNLIARLRQAAGHTK